MGQIGSFPWRGIKVSLRWLTIGLTIGGGVWMAFYEWQGLREIRAGREFVILGEVFIALIFVTTCVPLWLISYAVFARKFYVAMESGSVLLASGAFCGSVWALTLLPIALWIQLLKGPFYPAYTGSVETRLHMIEEVLLRLWLGSLPIALAGGTYYICRTLGRRTWVRPPPLNLKRHAD